MNLTFNLWLSEIQPLALMCFFRQTEAWRCIMQNTLSGCFLLQRDLLCSFSCKVLLHINIVNTVWYVRAAQFSQNPLLELIRTSCCWRWFSWWFSLICSRWVKIWFSGPSSAWLSHRHALPRLAGVPRLHLFMWHVQCVLRVSNAMWHMWHQRFKPFKVCSDWSNAFFILSTQIGPLDDFVVHVYLLQRATALTVQMVAVAVALWVCSCQSPESDWFQNLPGTPAIPLIFLKFLPFFILPHEVE